jgi:hypothetical protein
MTMTTAILTFKFKAINTEGKPARFNIKEPSGPNASRYAWERAEKIAEAANLRELKFCD